MKKNIITTLVFLILIIIVTYPLVFKIATCMPGFFSSDESTAPVWDSWRIKYSWENQMPLNYTKLINYPFGLDMYSSGFMNYGFYFVMYLLSLLTTPILTYNLQVIMNIFFSAFFTYALVFVLTKNRLSAFFCGIIFAFCPYQFSRIWQHLSLTYIQWIPLVLLSGILLKEEFNRKRAILFCVSLFLLFLFDFSTMYFGTVSLGIFLMYIIFYNWRIKFFKTPNLLKHDIKYVSKIVLLGLLVLIILLPQFYPLIRNYFNPPLNIGASGYNPYHRPFEDLFTQSAKPLSYLLPATFHPVFGKFTTMFAGSRLWGVSFTEHQLYLGWVPLILAFVAVKRWWRERKLRGQSPLGTVPSHSPQEFYIGFFVFLAIAAWLFSQPPWWQIGNFRIYLPSFFMYKILPMYRAYCRFGIVVMLAVSVLAGYGLKFLLERFKGKWAKYAVSALCCGLVLFEFWTWPPYKVIDVSKAPAVYYWLKAQEGGFAIGEYPLDYDGPNEMYKFYQIFHHKPIINGTAPGTYANKVAQEIKDLSSVKTAEILKWMGVRYVIVHRQRYEATGLVDKIRELERIPRNKGLKLIKRFPAQDSPEGSYSAVCMQKAGPIDVYEVIARPRELVVE